jgi:hypothetical protein
MPANGYTVGRDISVDVIGPNGPIRFTGRTGFEPKQESAEIKVRKSDGIIDTIFIPDGWTGTIDFERYDSRLDDYFAGIEADYFNGLNIPSNTITETIVEKNGTVSTYQYTNVALKYDSAGSRGDPQGTVKQRVAFAASRRIKL